MLPNQIPLVQTCSRLHHRVLPKRPKLKYDSFFCNMLIISAFHINSVPFKLCHERNATKGEKINKKRNWDHRKQKFMPQML